MHGGEGSNITNMKDGSEISYSCNKDSANSGLVEMFCIAALSDG